MMFKKETKVKTRKRDKKIRIRESELERRETESMLLGAVVGMGATVGINMIVKLTNKFSKKPETYKGSMECLCK